MIIRESFKDGDLALLVENVKSFIPEHKYLRLKTLLLDTSYTFHTKVTDSIKLFIIKWVSGVEWATEVDETDTKILKSITDSNFTKV